MIDLRDKASFYWLCFALLCGTLWFCGRFANSRFGLVIRGAKSNELRMTALGFPVFRYRLAAFTLSGAFGGASATGFAGSVRRLIWLWSSLPPSSSLAARTASLGVR